MLTAPLTRSRTGGPVASAPVRPRSLFPLLFVAALLAPMACSSHHVAAKVETHPVTHTTNTTVDPNHRWITEIATAKVPQVQVFHDQPGQATTTTAAPAAAPQAAPIPRTGLNSVGVAVAPNGYAYTNPTYFNNPLVFDVVHDEGDWLSVSLLARPNQQVGWIRRDDVTVSTTEYHMELTLSDFDLKVFEGSNLVVETKVVVGTPSTPTPLGHFYLTEKIARPPAGAYGPWIMATSAYSEQLDSFDGGLPQVAFHGTNQPALVGTQSSNGCVRMPDAVDVQLAGLLPPGTPITIQA
jgi:L,D-transpeptidase catalytic domain